MKKNLNCLEKLDVKLEKSTKKLNHTTTILLTDENHNYFEKSSDGKEEKTTLKIGLGSAKINRRKFMIVIRKLIHFAKMYQLKKIAIALKELQFPGLNISETDTLELIATNLKLANYEFVNFQTPPKEGWNFVEQAYIITDNISEEMHTALNRGIIAAEEVNNCRMMVNMPSNYLRPTSMAKQVEEKFKDTKVKVTVYGKKEIEAKNMGGILEVASGSEQDPKLIILEYMNGGDETPIALVGKAVTYDSGGLCLKPGPSLLEMHMDMAGGAAAVYAVAVAARLELKKNIVAVIPSVENLISMTNYRTNDIITSMSGQTIEILNTDAEGRLILADALTYVEKYNPRLIIDIATLTGASRIALGLRATAMFATDEKLEKTCRDLGEVSGDYVWPLPLWEEYKQDVKGTVSDLANIPVSNARSGGAVTAAAFLSHFVKENTPWVHLDIAPRMTSLKEEFLAIGATGEPVKLLAKIMETI